MANHSEILFISDLHLGLSNPELTEYFFSFINARCCKARALYILGDLFEVWLGDDDTSDVYKPIISTLKDLSKKVQVFFIHGNRDFLVGEQLAKLAGFNIIHDSTVITLGSNRIALMHGDTLCSDDLEYQEFRKMVRSQRWKTEFLLKPLTERQEIATTIRQQSGEAMTKKSMLSMDANSTAVTNSMEQLDVDILIHGHTHKPKIHCLEKNKKRIVIGDWHPQPSYLSWNNDQFELVDDRVSDGVLKL